MALVIGTNCGFVAVAPSADPTGTNTDQDGYGKGTADTSHATAVKVTEIGWWCDNATEEANYEVGIYADDAGSPGALLHSDTVNAKGTASGWIRATVDFAISGSTKYWICWALADTATTTSTVYDAVGGEDYCNRTGDTLPNPWDGSEGVDYVYGVYAKWEAAAPGGAAGIMTTNTGYWGPTF